eukprot:3266109-Rhodomonas_salina.3
MEEMKRQQQAAAMRHPGAPSLPLSIHPSLPPSLLPSLILLFFLLLRLLLLLPPPLPPPVDGMHVCRDVEQRRGGGGGGRGDRGREEGREGERGAGGRGGRRVCSVSVTLRIVYSPMFGTDMVYGGTTLCACYADSPVLTQRIALPGDDEVT